MRHTICSCGRKQFAKKLLTGLLLFTLVLTGCAQGTNKTASNTPDRNSPDSPPTNNPTIEYATGRFTTQPAIRGLAVVSSHLDVSPVQEASLTIQVKPGAKASIEVDYSSGPSHDSSLRPKIADKNGNVSWSWKVPLNTTPGTWNVPVAADGKSMMLQLHVTK